MQQFSLAFSCPHTAYKKQAASAVWRFRIKNAYENKLSARFLPKIFASLNCHDFILKEKIRPYRVPGYPHSVRRSHETIIKEFTGHVKKFCSCSVCLCNSSLLFTPPTGHLWTVSEICSDGNSVSREINWRLRIQEPGPQIQWQFEGRYP